MSSNSSDSDEKKPNGGSFTVDADATREMPSITRLLNRKKLGGSKGSKTRATADKTNTGVAPLPPPTADTAPLTTPNREENDGGTMTGLPKPDFTRTSFPRATPTLTPLVPSEPELPPLESPVASSSSAEPPKVQRVERRRTRVHSVQKPIVWTLEQLRAGADPLGKGLAILIEKGAHSALFLSITPPPPGGRVPLFVSTAAAMADANRLATWAGLRWDPSVVPETWNALLKQGYVELTPAVSRPILGTLRASFGAAPSETLLLVRVGPVNACRGMLAVISHSTLLMEIPKVFSLFNAPLVKAAG